MRLGVSNARKTTTTTNDDDDDDGDGIYDISVVYDVLCGDTAYLHKEVLPEVVLGEFHAAIRAPSQFNRGNWKRKQKSGDSGDDACTGGGGWDDVSAAAAAAKSFPKGSCGSVRSR
jgi:hypothetical protein